MRGGNLLLTGGVVVDVGSRQRAGGVLARRWPLFDGRLPLAGVRRSSSAGVSGPSSDQLDDGPPAPDVVRGGERVGAEVLSGDALHRQRRLALIHHRQHLAHQRHNHTTQAA